MPKKCHGGMLLFHRRPCLLLIQQARRSLHASSAASHLPKDGPDLKSFIRNPPLPPKRRIPNVKKTILVSSGKGGVGKSTIAVNLACALSLLPSRPKVGVLDLDLHGPSVPTLLGTKEMRSERMEVVANHGVKSMSMGYLVGKGEGAVVWRGMMLQKATQQLLFDVDWSGDGGVDVLVVDMPPGTGDVLLSVGQLVVVDGAVIVSTPQDVALLDTKKGIEAFEKMGVPILGLLLNQAHYTCPSCSSKHTLFGSPAAYHELCADKGAKSLGELPLLSDVSEGGDRGVPEVLRDMRGEYAGIMHGAAGRLGRQIGLVEASPGEL